LAVLIEYVPCVNAGVHGEKVRFLFDPVPEFYGCPEDTHRISTNDEDFIADPLCKTGVRIEGIMNNLDESSHDFGGRNASMGLGQG